MVHGAGDQPAVDRLAVPIRPTAEQESLLHAALDEGERAIAAWEKFSSGTDLASLPDSAASLLPQVHRNLTRQGYEECTKTRLPEAYRQAYSKNQLLLSEMTPIVRAMHVAGIPTMLLEGLALSLATYQDRGARPLRTFDFLVPSEEADRALELLSREGWRSAAGHAMRLNDRQLRYRYAMDLVNQSGRILRLHWHLLDQSRLAATDADFWKRAWPLYVGEDRSLMLAPTDQVLHVCAHVENRQSADALWVTDAVRTIRAAKVDWEQLLESAFRLRLVLPLRDALPYLYETFQAPIPRSVIWRLAKEPVSHFALMEYRQHVEPAQAQGRWVTAVATYRGYLRGVRDWPWRRRLAGFPDYLMETLRLPNASHLPRVLVDWAAGRLRAPGGVEHTAR